MKLLEEMFSSDNEDDFRNERKTQSNSYETKNTSTEQITEIERERAAYEEEEKRFEKEEHHRLLEELKQKEEPKKIETIKNEMSFEQLLKIFLSRNRVAQCLYYPNFHSVVKGCFVRVGVMGKYRIAEIVCIKQVELYKINGIKTEKAFQIRYGDSLSVCRLNLLSNTVPDKTEFIRNIETARNSNTKPKLFIMAEKKAKELERFIRQEKSSEFIERVIENKKNVTGTFRCNTIAEMTALNIEKEEAERKGDATKVKQFEERIEEIKKEVKEVSNENKTKRNKMDTSYRKYEKELDVLNPCKRKKCRPELLFSSSTKKKEEPVLKEKKQQKNILLDFVKRQK